MNNGVKSISEVISAIKQVATTAHIVDYEKEIEKPAKKIVIAGILKYFG